MPRLFVYDYQSLLHVCGWKGVSSFCVGGRVCPHSVFGCLFLSLKIMYNTTLIVVVVTSNGRHLKKKL